MNNTNWNNFEKKVAEYFKDDYMMYLEKSASDKLAKFDFFFTGLIFSSLAFDRGQV